MNQTGFKIWKIIKRQKLPFTTPEITKIILKNLPINKSRIMQFLKALKEINAIK